MNYFLQKSYLIEIPYFVNEIIKVVKIKRKEYLITCSITHSNDNKKILFERVKLKKSVDQIVSQDKKNYYKSENIKYKLIPKNDIKSGKLFEKDVKKISKKKLSKDDCESILKVITKLQEIENN